MPAPATYGIGLCAVLVLSAGVWSWANRDRARTVRTAENWALGIALVVILVALWAALLLPWPHI
jgi:uncharacterized membrane protein YccC